MLAAGPTFALFSPHTMASKVEDEPVRCTLATVGCWHRNLPTSPAPYTISTKPASTSGWKARLRVAF